MIQVFIKGLILHFFPDLSSGIKISIFFQGTNKTPKKPKASPIKPVNGNTNCNDNGSISYASITAAAKQTAPPGSEPGTRIKQTNKPPPVAPPMETTEPQLMSPMVFTGQQQGQEHQPSPGPAVVPVRAPVSLPVSQPVSIPASMPMIPGSIPPPVLPFNGIPLHMPVQIPQITPLTEAQLMQVNF